MWTNIIILSLVTLQRLVEIYIAHRNTAKLIDRGGFEISSGYYHLFIGLHAVWLAGLWYLAFRLEVSWPWIFGYLVLEAARGWIIAALGSRWTTRIILVPGETLAEGGLHGYFRQSNYFVVAVEIFLLPAAFGLWWYAVLFAVLNAALLYWRIRSEDAALAPLREPPQPLDDQSV